MIIPVSFELAKLLKEKGFRVLPTFESSYPTIAEVVMWLYEKHDIWIYTRPVLDEDGEWIFKGYVKLMNNFKAKEYQTKLLRKPTEAYEAAIEYTLNHLI
jgi:hypothetical protein